MIVDVLLLLGLVLVAAGIGALVGVGVTLARFFDGF